MGRGELRPARKTPAYDEDTLMNGHENWIAIVGMGCRFPGNVSTPAALREFLRHHGDGVKAVPANRWSSDAFYDPDRKAPGKSYVRHAAFVDQDIYTFDPAPFGISAREADRLDPQQRLLLETSWEAFEDAGLPLERVRGSNTGVFVGGFMLDHRDLSASTENLSRINAHTSVGATMTVLSNRLSYTYDLHGPSMTIDTACSSSLVATHLACRSLLADECDQALAGGVNVMLYPSSTIIMCKGQFLAPDGRCKAFDARANGYGRGEGAGIILLKKLGRALADGDRIYAVIRATGVNQDGRTDGMPMPSGEAQQALARRVLAASGAAAHTVGYVEAHGTGTRIGDPIEAGAIGAVYGGSGREPLRIGSVKTNIGHLEAAAGVAGLIKTVLAVNNREILPQRPLESPNPDIPFAELNVKVAAEAEPWPIEGPAVAAINSFGYGGTNAHAIIGQWTAAPAARRSRTKLASSHEASTPKLFAVSAFSRAALQAHAAALATAVEEEPSRWLDVGYTLAQRRSHLPERAVIRAASAEELGRGLQKLASGGALSSLVQGRQQEQGKLMFVFTGMGPQWWAMGRSLYDTEPVFRAAVEEVDHRFFDLSGWSIIEELLRDEADSHMHENRVAQPANFLLQVGLVRLLEHLGVRPEGYLGHSVGEVAAAWASGALSLEQAVLVAFQRSRLQQKLAGQGTLLAAAVSPARALELIPDEADVSIAAINGRESVALAGCRRDLEVIASVLEAQGVFNKMMNVEIAYHSPHMDPLMPEFYACLAIIDPDAPKAPLYSTVYGSRVVEAIHDADYWWKNARQPVLLKDALEAAIDDGYTDFVEVGPHRVLAAAITDALRAKGQNGRSYYALKRKESETESIYNCVAALHTAGVGIDWSRQFTEGSSVDLPHYAFDRAYHWDESIASKEKRMGREGAMPLAQLRSDGASTRFCSDLGRATVRYLFDHVVQNAVVFPAAGYIDAALSALVELAGKESTPVLEEMHFEKAFVLRKEGTPWLMTDIHEGVVTLSGRHDEEEWTRHAHLRSYTHARFLPAADLDLGALRTGLHEVVDVARFYSTFDAMGMQYGPAFRRITQMQRHRVPQTGGQVLARIGTADLELETSVLHPTVLDAAFQALLGLLPEGAQAGAMVPVSLRQLRVMAPVRGDVWVFGKVDSVERSLASITGTLVIVDDAGRVLAQVDGLVCRALTQPRERIQQDARQWLHTEVWQPVDVDAEESASSQRWVLLGPKASVDALAVAFNVLGIAAQSKSSVAQALAAGATHVALVSEAQSDDPARWQAGAQLLADIQALAKGSAAITLLTHQAQGLHPEEHVDPNQTALLGLGRVVMTEQPGLQARLLDLPAGNTVSADDWQAAARALAYIVDEEEMAVRGGAVVARRLQRPGTVANTPRQSQVRRARGRDLPFELVARGNGRGDNLVYRPRCRRTPTGDQIELEVQAASLNFKDLMKSLGMLSTTALDRTYLGTGLGLEAAGKVVAVGPEVTRFKVGDTAHVYYGGCLASHVTVSEKFAVVAEADRTITDSACLFVFMTAWYALDRAANLRAGESVLIHSAAGGVGLACVQIARYRGARIFATAGTEEKRQYLRRLGIEHVYDSRTLDFADAIRRDTFGRGVDVVVNSLAGVALEKSLDLLAGGGRFVELGKQDIAANTRLGLLPFNRSLTFAAVDLDRMATERPEYFAPLATEVVDAFSRGILQPLPTEVFTAEAAGEAFQRFATGKVIGKVVVDFRDAEVPVAAGLAHKPLVRAERSYLVTGGLGGFGLATAQWLVDKGARNVILASRRGQPDDEAKAAILRMTSAGANVSCRPLDVSSPASVAELMDWIGANTPPLAGVFHSAMVLDDAPVASLGEEQLLRVWKPKAYGAWLLHQATGDVDLDHFVVYGSVSAQVGNPNQAAYAAANAYLEGLVAHRRARGLCGTCVNWGAIGEVGALARDNTTEQHLAGLGLTPLPPQRALEVLGTLLQEDHARFGVIAIDWGKWIRALPHTGWQRLSTMADSQSEQEGGVLARIAAELAGLTREARHAAIVERLQQQASAVLKTPAEAIDPSTSLKDYGLDSLMAVELQVALETNLGTTFSTMELLAGRSLANLAERVRDTLASLSDTKVGATQSARPDVAKDGPALRAHLLSRISVQTPYFALNNFRRDGEWLLAEAEPTAPSAYEAGPVACAEAGRHLAILGSCAASMQNPEPGRSCYPVRGSQLVRHAGRASEGVLGKVALRARCTRFDSVRCQARAETQLLDMDGNVISVFTVDYHVIPAATFATLFAAHAQPTHEKSGVDPYLQFSELPAVVREGGAWRADLGPVLAEACAGHFEGVPAYPVSIMLRDATALVSTAMRQQSGNAKLRISVVGGEARTERFIFAGERAVLQAHRLEQGSPDAQRQRWRVDVGTAEAHAASFEMEVEAQASLQEPRGLCRDTPHDAAAQRRQTAAA